MSPPRTLFSGKRPKCPVAPPPPYAFRLCVFKERAETKEGERKGNRKRAKERERMKRSEMPTDWPMNKADEMLTENEMTKWAVKKRRAYNQVNDRVRLAPFPAPLRPFPP